MAAAAAATSMAAHPEMGTRTEWKFELIKFYKMNCSASDARKLPHKLPEHGSCLMRVVLHIGVSELNFWTKYAILCNFLLKTSRYILIKDKLVLHMNSFLHHIKNLNHIIQDVTLIMLVEK